MNVLSERERAQVVSALVDGCSLRATHRMTGLARQTITNLLLSVGEGCRCLSDALMRDLHCDVLELDEVWTYVGCKEGHRDDERHPPEFGDQYTWIALDARTKLVPVHLVAKRTAEAAHAFARDLRSRVLGAPQITTDGFKPYVEAIEGAFGARVQYAQILKEYRADESGGASRDDVRYSRGRVVRSTKRVIVGTPDKDTISTSYVERQNLTVRMSQRRFTRLTNGFSKRAENLRAAVALHFAYYNLCRVHQTLRVTPAMESGVADHVWSVPELIEKAQKALDEPPPMPPVGPAPPPRGGSYGRRSTRTEPLPGQLPLPGVL